MDRLREYGDVKEADSVASAMELSLKNMKQSGEQFKSFFETILNAKKSDSAPSAPPPPPFPGSALFGGAPPPPPMAMAPMSFAANTALNRACSE